MTGDYKNRRFNIPQVFRKWIDRYDIQGEMIQDLLQRKPELFYVETFVLDTAQTAANPKILSVPGRGFVFYAYTTGDTTKAESPETFIGTRINQNSASSEFPAKHGRGYRGDLVKLFLNWPAQANTSVDFIIFKFDARPFQPR